MVCELGPHDHLSEQREDLDPGAGHGDAEGDMRTSEVVLRGKCWGCGNFCIHRPECTAAQPRPLRYVGAGLHSLSDKKSQFQLIIEAWCKTK